MPVTCQPESFLKAMPDIIGLIDPHWDEVGSFKAEFDRQIDFNAYVKLHAEGRLLTVTAREDDGRLVGYYVGAVGLDLHRVTKSDPPRRVGVLSALVYYILPEKRGHARALIGAVERAASASGIQIVNVRVKPGANDAGAFFDLLNYRVIEVTRTKLIGTAAHARDEPKVA